MTSFYKRCEQDFDRSNIILDPLELEIFVKSWNVRSFFPFSCIEHILYLYMIYLFSKNCYYCVCIMCINFASLLLTNMPFSHIIFKITIFSHLPLANLALQKFYVIFLIKEYIWCIYEEKFKLIPDTFLKSIK